MNEYKQVKVNLGNGVRLKFQTRYVFLMGLISYRIMLDICYFQVINKKFAYLGLVDKRSGGLLALSWVVFFVYFIAINGILEEEKVSITNIVIFCFDLLVFIPFTTLIYSGILSSTYILYNFIYTIILIISVRIINHINFGTIRLKINKNSSIDFIINVIGIASIAVVLYISYRYAGFRLNFNLAYVYDLRLDARTFTMPTFMQYLFSWTKIINNILLAYSIINKKWIWALIYFSTQMYSFGIDGSKSSFFMTFIVIAISFIGIGAYQSIKKIAVWGAAGLTAASFIEPILFDSSYIATYIIRRVMFVPVYLGDCYVDYFSTHTPDYFRSSFLRMFGATSQYSSSGGISRIIGQEYFNSSTMNCNNGLLSDAIANLGVVGIIVMPVLIIVILKLMDMCAGDMDSRIFLVVAVYFAVCLTNSFLFTVLLTHGMLISMVIFLVIGNRKRALVRPKRQTNENLNIQGEGIEKI